MTEIHAFDPDGTPSPGAAAALNPLATRIANLEANGGGGGGNMEGLSGIRALTAAEYEAITPDPTVLYIVTGDTPVEPEEPAEQGTLDAPVFRTPTYGGSASSSTSVTVPRPPDLATGDLLVIALRSQDPTGTSQWAGDGFTNVAPLAESGEWASARVGAVLVKPITDAASEPKNYTLTGPTGRNAAVAIPCNVGTTTVHGVSTAPHGEPTDGIARVRAHTLNGAPALSLVAMGAECTAGISSVPSTIPDGYTQVGNAQSSLDGSTSGSRTAIWLGWKAWPTAEVPTLVGGFAGSSAPAIYAGAIAGGA